MSIVINERVVLDPPRDPELARLWGVAVAKAELRYGRAPARAVEWNQVVDDYHALLGKARGSVAEVVRRFVHERCAGIPVTDRED